MTGNEGSAAPHGRDMGIGAGADEGADEGPTRAWTRRRSFTYIAVIYVIASAAGVITADAIGSGNAAWAMAAGYAVSTAVLYAASQVVGNGSTFDAWWSVMPPVIAVWLVLTSDGDLPGGDGTGLTDVLRPVVLVLVIAWGVRLTANWALGWPGMVHEDWRYRRLYDTVPLPRWAVSLLAVHLFPTATVAVASLPLVAVLTTHDVTGWPVWRSALAAAGVVMTAAAIAVEHLADVELRAFNRRKSPGDVLDTGWWARSRHPNYLGEMGFWWGLALCATAVGSWWTSIGAVVITVMFLTASIPLLETRSAERRPGWADYAARTPMLLPRLSHRGSRRGSHRGSRQGQAR